MEEGDIKMIGLNFMDLCKLSSNDETNGSFGKIFGDTKSLDGRDTL